MEDKERKGSYSWKKIVVVIFFIVVAYYLFQMVRVGILLKQSLDSGGLKLSTDSDGDGIPDAEDTHPNGGGRYINKLYEWDYGLFHYTYELDIHTDWYDYYKNKPRSDSISSSSYVTWDDPSIKRLAEAIKKKAEEEGKTKSQFAASFIQSLHYAKDVGTGYDEYPKYPVETLVEESGDCEDTSYLSAAIIGAMGIDTVLVVFDNHMGIGVWCDGCSGSYYELNGRKYYYLETTGERWELGQLPEEYQGKNATIIKIFS